MGAGGAPNGAPSAQAKRPRIERLELVEGDPERVAGELGISRNNLKVRRHRARQALRQRLEETCRMCAEHAGRDCACKRA